MRKPFATSWKSSVKPSKQRNYLRNAPLHIKRKGLAAHLSKPLHTQYHKRSFTLVTGDTVKVMRGQYKGRQGKIERVETAAQKVYITGIGQTRKNGAKGLIPLRPSNLEIVELNLKDPKRKARLSAESTVAKPATVKVATPKSSGTKARS